MYYKQISASRSCEMLTFIVGGRLLLLGTSDLKPSPAACHFQLCQLLVAQLWALHGNNDPATTRPSNQSQRLPGARGTQWRKPRLKGLGTGQTEYEEIGWIDWTWCGENTKLTHFISSSTTKWLWGKVGFKCPNCQEVACDVLWVSSNCPSAVNNFRGITISLKTSEIGNSN